MIWSSECTLLEATASPRFHMSPFLTALRALFHSVIHSPPVQRVEEQEETVMSE